ncbi:MAG: lipase family protein [Lachnospiraceae bacterium]|nr:lipase family protein [Lachnospiraceae bacterium]
MNLKKIITASLVAVLSVTTVFSVGACQASAESPKKTVDFSYPDGAFDHEEMNASVVYSDDFFSKKATKRNDSLALLSVGAADAVYNKDDIRDFLKTCGFTNKRDSVTDENSDDLSFNFGKKKIGKKTVVAVILQGTASNDEWKSNLRLGDSLLDLPTVHAGFNATEKAVHKKLNTFLKTNKLKKGSVAFWVTGHSRGAAVANIMAKRLSDTYGKSNVYAYTFASPKVVKVSTKTTNKYSNIFNYVNPDDVVTRIPTKDTKSLEDELDRAGILNEEKLKSGLNKIGLSISVNFELGTYRRFGTDIEMSSEDHSTMAETFSDITGVDFDETSVAHNHCQSCYLSWLMG